MSPEWQQFLSVNASAVFGLIGALGGGLLSFFASLLLKHREFNLQIRSKLLDRQIAAHENILKLATEMRQMVAPGDRDSTGEIRRIPRIMLSKESFEDWFSRFTELQLQGTTWLSTSTKREVSFVQDYLVALHLSLSEIPPSKCFALGELIREDFIDLSASLEKKAFEFFEKGIRKSSPDSLNKWHKYKPHVTKERLMNTFLMRNINQFKTTINAAPYSQT